MRGTSPIVLRPSSSSNRSVSRNIGSAMAIVSSYVVAPALKITEVDANTSGSRAPGASQA